MEVKFFFLGFFIDNIKISLKDNMFRIVENLKL